MTDAMWGLLIFAAGIVSLLGLGIQTVRARARWRRHVDQAIAVSRERHPSQEPRLGPPEEWIP